MMVLCSRLRRSNIRTLPSAPQLTKTSVLPAQTFADGGMKLIRANQNPSRNNVVASMAAARVCKPRALVRVETSVTLICQHPTLLPSKPRMCSGSSATNPKHFHLESPQSTICQVWQGLTPFVLQSSLHRNVQKLYHLGSLHNMSTYPVGAHARQLLA